MQFWWGCSFGGRDAALVGGMQFWWEGMQFWWGDAVLVGVQFWWGGVVLVGGDAVLN